MKIAFKITILLLLFLSSISFACEDKDEAELFNSIAIEKTKISSNRLMVEVFFPSLWNEKLIKNFALGLPESGGEFLSVDVKINKSDSDTSTAFFYIGVETFNKATFGIHYQNSNDENILCGGIRASFLLSKIKKGGINNPLYY